MASMPAHPFWLFPLNIVASGKKLYGDGPEAGMGPGTLFYMVNKYLRGRAVMIVMMMQERSWTGNYETAT